MLNIKQTPSTNNVDIVGILKEISIEEKTSADGSKEFIVGKATIKVDQKINDNLCECEIPIEMYANKQNKDGSVSKLYPMIKAYAEKFTSLAACPEDEPQKASKVVVKGAQLSENVWFDQQSGTPRSSYRIRSNFLNPYTGSDKDFNQQAVFEITGVILKTEPEIDKDSNETGRLKVTVAVVTYDGNVDIIPMIAESPVAIDHINQNWNEGDTVKIAGRIKFSFRTETSEEEVGFGDPIVHSHTVSFREFVICSGSRSGFDEDASYDASDIAAALEARQARIKESKNKTANKNQGAAPKSKFDW